MKPRGLLMREHRLIEKAIDLMKSHINVIDDTQLIDPFFIDSIADFMRFYADDTHHGKEEEILFHQMKKKELSPKDDTLVDELLNEHIRGRELLQQLMISKARYMNDERTELPVIRETLHQMVELYSEHIPKEDNICFPRSEQYFSEDELNNMLKQCFEFDQKMIHEKYRSLIKNLQESQEFVFSRK